MVTTQNPRSFPAAKLLTAGSLCIAIAGVTQTWANSQQDILNMLDKGSAVEEVRREDTPAEQLFSTGWMESTSDGLQLNLRVPEGVPQNIEGLLQVVEEEGTSLITLQENLGSGYIETRNSAGAYGRIHVRRLEVSLDELFEGPEPGSEARAVFSDDIYTTYQRILIVLGQKRDFITRDSLLQANNALFTLRANGDVEVDLYRRRAGEELENLGRLLMDYTNHYELTGTVTQPEYHSAREVILLELQSVEKQLSMLDEQAVQLVESGNREGLQPKLALIEELKERKDTLIKQVQPMEEFELFAVTETIDYEASHWLKYTNQSGMETAGQAVSFKILSAMYETEAAQMIRATELKDLNFYINNILKETLDQYSRVRGGQGEGMPAYIARRLATAWSVMQPSVSGQSVQGYDTPPSYVQDSTLASPVLRIRGVGHHVTNGLTLEKSLKEMRSVMTSFDKVQPDKFEVSEEQLREMKEALSKSGWIAWLKSFYNASAYQPTKVSDELRLMMKQKNASHLFGLVQSSGIEGGVPVRVINQAEGTDSYEFTGGSNDQELTDKANSALNRKVPKVLVMDIPEDQSKKLIYRTEKLTDSVQEKIDQRQLEAEVSRARKILGHEVNKQKPSASNWASKAWGTTWGTAMAAGSGAATGYIVQRGVDMTSKYYNEGVSPWSHSSSASDAQDQQRAQRAGVLMGLSGAINYNILPRVAENSKYFQGVTGHALMNQGLKGNFDATVAGGISGFAARSAVTGYQYLRGEMTGTEAALDVADAAGRVIPTVAGSALGHWALPYAFNVPYVSAFLPVGFVGALGGSMAGNMAYDTAKHYTFAGAKAVRDYVYGDAPTAQPVVAESPQKDPVVDEGAMNEDSVTDTTDA